MGLIDTPNPKVAEQRMLALAAPCTRFEVGELLDRIKMVLIVRQNETHFVEVVAAELGTIHDAVKDAVDLEPSLFWRSTGRAASWKCSLANRPLLLSR